jgi:hypothetical protein
MPVVPLALLLLTACATTPESQAPIPLTTGDRVRITLANRVATGPVLGTVVSLSPDTIVVAREKGGERRLSRAQVQEVEISVSRKCEPGKAVGYGVLAAAPLLIIPVIFTVVSDIQTGVAILGFVLLPAAIAGGVGGLISGGPQDAWVTAVWPSHSTALPFDTLDEES